MKITYEVIHKAEKRIFDSRLGTFDSHEKAVKFIKDYFEEKGFDDYLIIEKRYHRDST